MFAFSAGLRPAVLCLVSVVFLAGADWPQFRGPSADGESSETNLPLTWPATQGVAWKTELPGPGASSPIIWGDKIYLTAYNGYGVSLSERGEMSNLKRHAICLDATTGNAVWSREIPAELLETKYEGNYISTHGYASSTPVTDGEKLYFFFGRTGVFAFKMTGEQVWQAKVGSRAHAWGHGSSPVLYQNLVIFNASAEGNELAAPDKDTGRRVWAVGDMPSSWNTPILVPTPDGTGQQLIVNVSGKVRGIDPATGKERWFCGGIRAAELCPSVLVRDGMAFIIGSPGGRASPCRSMAKGTSLPRTNCGK